MKCCLRKKLNITDDKQEYHAWYYNSELLKGVVFNSLTDYEYLGIINFQNLCFSDTESKYYLDIPNYDISYDNTTGNQQYYFLANYNPIIKLNSITADYADNGQRSYVVLLDFEYLIQMPMWMFSTELPDKIDRIVTNRVLALPIFAFVMFIAFIGGVLI